MNNSLSEYQINYLGALLHDFGKLIWRAQEIKAGDDHESLGSQFIREYLGKVECLKTDIEKIIKAANRQSGKIWKADVIAAQEREDSLDKAPRRYLEAITNRVEFDKPFKKNKTENYWYYIPRVLSLLERDNFPENNNKILEDYEHNDGEYIEHHKNLLKGFIEELKLLYNETEFGSFILTFYYLLEKYTTKVLSAGYLSHPDISLFDHSRITAALSTCFEKGEENKECLLIKGDISGIQNYIYNGIREMTYIAKRLRGRSFTIQLLTGVISNFFLEQLNLFEANLIYDGGGHFLMLAPNNTNIKEELVKVENNINEFLSTEYIGRVSLILEKVECSGKEFIGDFRNIYLQLDNKLNERKKKKNRNQLSNLFSNSLEASNYHKKEKEIENEEKQVGEIIPKIKYLVTTKDKIEKIVENKFVSVSFKGLNTYVYLCKELTEIEDILSNIVKKNNVKITTINDTDFVSKLNRTIFYNTAKGFRFIGRSLPLDGSQQPKSFEDLAEEHSKSYPLLGIMRMDVDNLGAVFSFGLKELREEEKKYTPSRVANLSRELNWFFTGYINEIAKAYNIYIAYSGGDDLFVVGNWYQIIKFANELRKKLRAFVCENEHLSASAGIIFTKPNFPISQSALLAEVQEKIAKDTCPNKLEKNKVGVLNIQLTWEEFDEFIKYADELIEFLESDEGKKIIPRSFLYNLYSLTGNVFDSKGMANLKKLSKAKSTLHYLFARRKVNSNIIEQKNDSKTKVNNLLYKLAVRLLLGEDKEKEFKKIKFPLTLALYKTRR